MRLDHRQMDELRPVKLIPQYTDFAEGSVLIEVGKTRVLCNTTIEDAIPRWMQAQGKTGGWLTAEYAMLPRATLQRTPRENTGLGGRTQEIRRLIGRCLRTALNLDLLGARTVIVDCDVIQADGGTRTAAITGGYVSLALAIQRLIQAGNAPAGILQNPVAAVSVGIVDHHPMLDLCYSEDSRAQVDANICMNSAGQFIEVQLSAEGAPFPQHSLDALIELARRGINELFAIQEAVLSAL